MRATTAVINGVKSRCECVEGEDFLCKMREEKKARDAAKAVEESLREAKAKEMAIDTEIAKAREEANLEAEKIKKEAQAKELEQKAKTEKANAKAEAAAK